MELASHLDYFQQANITNFPFIDLIYLVQIDNELESLIVAMLFYVGNFEPSVLTSRGENAVRPFCLFITNLAERNPQLIFKNIALIVPFLSFDVNIF